MGQYLKFFLIILTASLPLKALQAQDGLQNWAKKRAYGNPLAAQNSIIGTIDVKDLLPALDVHAREGGAAIRFEKILPDRQLLITLPPIKMSLEQSIKAGQQAIATTEDEVVKQRGAIGPVHIAKTRNQRIATLSAYMISQFKDDEFGFFYMGAEHADDIYALTPYTRAAYVGAKPFVDGCRGSAGLVKARKIFRSAPVCVLARDMESLAGRDFDAVDYTVYEAQIVAHYVEYILYIYPHATVKDIDLSQNDFAAAPSAFILAAAHASPDRSFIKRAPSAAELKNAGKNKVAFLLEDLKYKPDGYSYDEVVKHYIEDQCDPINAYYEEQIELILAKKHPHQNHIHLSEADLESVRRLMAEKSLCNAEDIRAFYEMSQGYAAAGLQVRFNGLEVYDDEPLMQMISYMAQLYLRKTHAFYALKKTGKFPEEFTQAELDKQFKDLDLRVAAYVRRFLR